MRSNTVELTLFHESATGPSTSIPTYLNANAERNESFTGTVQSVLISPVFRRKLQLRVRFLQDPKAQANSLDYKITIAVTGTEQSFYIPASYATKGKEYIFRTFWQTTPSENGKSRFEPAKSGLRCPQKAGPMSRERNDTAWQISPESNECCVAVFISRGTLNALGAKAKKNGLDICNLPTDPPEKHRNRDTGIPKPIKDSWFQSHLGSEIEAFQFLNINRIEVANEKPLNEMETLTREQVKNLLGSTYAGIAEDTYIVNPTPIAKVAQKVKREWSFEDSDGEEKQRLSLPTKRKQPRQKFQPKWNLDYSASIPSFKKHKPSFSTSSKPSSYSSTGFQNWQDFDDDEDDEELLPVKQEQIESPDTGPSCGNDASGVPVDQSPELKDGRMLQLKLEENLLRQEIRRKQLRKQVKQ